VILRPVEGRFDFPPDAPFDVAAFLAAPRVARVATLDGRAPVVRPMWFLWEDSAFWIFVGHWSKLEKRLAAEPVFDLVVDDCDLTTGRVRQVVARGHGAVLPFDVPRARRKLVRYLGPDEERWDRRFSLHAEGDAGGLRWARLAPTRLLVKDLSFGPAAVHEGEGTDGTGGTTRSEGDHA
jgi:hypothetical protein